MPPVDLASIGAVLRAQQIEPRILEMRTCKEPFEALERELNTWRPDAIITNMATATAMDDYPLLHRTRNRVQRRIVFGFHAMALPNEQFEQGATHVLIGDPEYSAAAAVRGENKGVGICTPENPTVSPGWLESLDALPYPALDLLDVKGYHSLIMRRDAFTILLSSRGCPYSCTFCVMPFQFGKKVRMMSVDRIVGEIERDLDEFNIRSFFFVDSAMNLKPKWTVEFCEELLRRNLKIRWCGNMRVSPISREMLGLMKRSGCFRLFYGVEDLDLVEEINKKITRAAAREAFALTRAAGIESVAFIILFPGLDQSEQAMARRIVNMVTDLKADALQCNLSIPYPGSKIFPEYMERYNMSRDWSLYDPAGSQLPYPTELNLVRVRRMVYLRYFLRNPVYVLNYLRRADAHSIYNFIKSSTHVLWGVR